MSRSIIRREELLNASLELGNLHLDLSSYATTGLRIVAMGQSGGGKTNAGLLIAEQLTQQGWIAVLVDPEGELESLYGAAVTNVEEFERTLENRDRRFVVVNASTPSEFVPFGQALLDVVDRTRKPVFVVLDEGQLFSSARRRKNQIGEASDIVDKMVEQGRKRALDVFVTALRMSSSLNRSIFQQKNLSLFGAVEDPLAWSSLGPQFRGTDISFEDLRGLHSGQFYCFSRSGVDKVSLPLADALKPVALQAKPIRQRLPTSFHQWDSAMRDIDGARLRRLTPEVVSLLGRVAGLTRLQLQNGARALRDELEMRS